MTAPPDMRLPPQVDRDAVLARLDRVLDPELDESVLTLGFVASVHGDSDGELTVELRLPTYWCAANFSYLMASDVQRELGQVAGVSGVSVRLPEHFAGDAIESGAGPGKSFAEAFPEGGPDTLEQTRRLFLRKGFFTRQEKLLRELKQAGLSFQEIAALRVGNVTASVDSRTAERYLERRRELGLDCSDSSHLIVDVNGAGDISGGPRNILHPRPDDAAVHAGQRGPLLGAVGGKANQPVSVPIIPSPRGRGLG